MVRLEFKYLVPLDKLDRMREAFEPFVEPDPYTENLAHEYTVRSIYFDTFDLNYYYEKDAGIQHRKKIRVRGYNEETETAPVFLEIKRKNDMTVWKHRAPVQFKNVGSLFSGGDIDQLVMEKFGLSEAREDARRFFYHVHRYSLRPLILVCYEREAFYRKFNDAVRITFDKNLRSVAYPELDDLFKDEGALTSLPGYFTLEVKFQDGIPGWLKAILNDFKLDRRSVSKYAISLDTHYIPQTISRKPVYAAAKEAKQFGGMTSPLAFPGRLS